MCIRDRKNVAQLLWEKAKDFLQKAFSVILVATIVVWFLQRFDLQLNMVEDSAHSIDVYKRQLL